MSAYTYWKEQTITALNAGPINIMQLSEGNFPTIDFKALYNAGLQPTEAAEIAKAINRFTKTKYFHEKR